MSHEFLQCLSQQCASAQQLLAGHINAVQSIEQKFCELSDHRPLVASFSVRYVENA